MIKVGDTVMWRGCFGADSAQPVEIEGLTLCERENEKYGIEVDAIFEGDIRRTLFSLKNGHWAYGRQVTPMR